MKVLFLLLNFICLTGMISALTLIENMWGFIIYSIGYIITLYIITDMDSQTTRNQTIKENFNKKETN